MNFTKLYIYSIEVVQYEDISLEINRIHERFF